ncbi:glycine zipper 2TM domain-containing protein [Phenylobacterium sp.]|uniref:glycine zipper 2TM domain-containing protein n=1 Tax=Phenylobacterium sp. TaxID=1871053 RepID=UPI00286DC591|nr:glycine zipper 2TM domain-containing protein [Phenylobacterium sp.]
MRNLIKVTAAAAIGLALTGCATTDNYASQCQRDYARNRQMATAAGSLAGAALGAAIAGEDDRETGAAIGALAGAVIGSRLSAEDDPCGYGFGGYNRDGRYGYERVPYGRYSGRY